MFYMTSEVFTIFGPTAARKTTIAIEVAKKLNSLGRNAEIVNFDSLLFYKGLNIGTAKPTNEEQAEIKHHLIDICNPDETLNASDYSKRAVPLIKRLLQEKSDVILVGGSGFYLRALLKGMYEANPTPDHIKEKINSLYQNSGIEPILLRLREVDPLSLTQLHENDHYRLIRALEFYETNKREISKEKIESQERGPFDFSKNIHEWSLIPIYLNPPKDIHLKIIEERVNAMLKVGLIHEVENLLKSGYTGEEKPLNSIGYKETQAYLRGEIKSKQDLSEAITISTRQLAKSQRTFFSKITPKLEINSFGEIEMIINQIVGFTNSK